MKNLFLLSIIISLFLSCNEQEEKIPVYATPVPEKDTPLKEPQPLDTASGFILDTIYSMYFDEKIYQLALGYGNYMDSTYGSMQNTVVTILLNNDTLYTEKLNFNTIGRLQNPAPGHYWIDLLNSGGGSGYSGTIFNIRPKPKPIMQTITTFGELSWWKSNKNATGLLYFSGYWDSEHGESHFEEHKQGVCYYEIKDNAVSYKDLGRTKYKYAFSEGNDENAFNEFRKKEKAIAAKINWADFE